MRSGFLLAGTAVLFGADAGLRAARAEADTYSTQGGWRWCSKCAVLFYGYNEPASVCPAGGTHVLVSAAYSYDIPVGVTAGTLNPQSGWKWCSKCQGIYYSPYAAASVCPAGGTHSTLTGTDAYGLYHGGGLTNQYQGGWAWCSKCQGLFFTQGILATVCPDGGAHDGGNSGQYFLQYG